MTRHIIKKPVVAGRGKGKGKQLAAKGRNRKNLHALMPEIPPEDVSDNEVVVVDNVENKGGRSPRRAALEAAKKIYNCARNYGTKNDDGGECSYRPRNPTPKSPTPRKIQIIYDLQESDSEEDLEGDLLLECEEDVLSEAQTKVFKRQQQAHNKAMKKIIDANLANERFFRAQMEFFKRQTA